MSTQFVLSGGGIEPRTSVALSTTNLTDVYTGRDEPRAAATEITIRNSHSSAVVVDIFYYDGMTNNHIWTTSLAADSSELVDIAIPLLDGHKVKAQADTANVVTVSILPLLAQQR